MEAALRQDRLRPRPTSRIQAEWDAYWIEFFTSMRVYHLKQDGEIFYWRIKCNGNRAVVAIPANRDLENGEDVIVTLKSGQKIYAVVEAMADGKLNLFMDFWQRPHELFELPLDEIKGVEVIIGPHDASPSAPIENDEVVVLRSVAELKLH